MGWCLDFVRVHPHCSMLRPNLENNCLKTNLYLCRKTLCHLALFWFSQMVTRSPSFLCEWSRSYRLHNWLLSPPVLMLMMIWMLILIMMIYLLMLILSMIFLWGYCLYVLADNQDLIEGSPEVKSEENSCPKTLGGIWKNGAGACKSNCLILAKNTKTMEAFR